jgi:hypothetical protein
MRRFSTSLALLALLTAAAVAVPPAARARGGGGGGGGGHSSGHSGRASSSHSTFSHSSHSGRIAAGGSLSTPHFGSSGHHEHHHHFHGIDPEFLAFFFPSFLVVGAPYAYDTYDDEGYPGEDAWTEPYYDDWQWSDERGYYICQYFLSPEEALLVIAYPQAPDFIYYYDPVAEQYIGVLDRSTGQFRYWYADEGRWSDAVDFPFSPPPATDR